MKTVNLQIRFNLIDLTNETATMFNQKLTHFSKMSSKAQGYSKGQPDLELRCKDGDRTDTIANELTDSPTDKTTCPYIKKNILNKLIIN